MDIVLSVLMNSGPAGQLELALCPVLALLLVVGCARLIKGRSLPPVLFVACLVLPMGLGLLGSWSGERMAYDAIARASAEVKMSLLAAGIAQGISVRMLAGGVMVILSTISILGCSVAATRSTPHGRGIPVVAVVISLGIAALAVVSGQLSENLLGGLLRGGFYVVMGGLVAAALRSTAKPSAGCDAGVVAAIALPVLVAGVEVAAMSIDFHHVFMAIAAAEPADKAAIGEHGLAQIAQQHRLALVSVVLGLVLAVVAALRSLEGTLRDAGIIGALLYALLLPLWLSADNMALMEHLTSRVAAVE